MSYELPHFMRKTISQVPSPQLVSFESYNRLSKYLFFFSFHIDNVQIDCFVLPCSLYHYNFNQIGLNLNRLLVFPLDNVEVIKRSFRKMQTSQVFTQQVTYILMLASRRMYACSGFQ